MKAEDKIILWDLDGTLANYNKMVETEINAMSCPSEPPFQLEHDDRWPEYIEHRRQAITRQIGWWLNLPKIESAFELYHWAIEKGFQSNILTKGPKDKYQAWAEKIEWCKTNTPESLVTITEDKSKVYGKVLVDDYPDYAFKWLKHRPNGLVVMPIHSYNKDVKHPQIILFDKNLEEVQGRINSLK